MLGDWFSLKHIKLFLITNPPKQLEDVFLLSRYAAILWPYFLFLNLEKCLETPFNWKDNGLVLNILNYF